MSENLFTKDYKTDPYWWDDAPRPQITPSELPQNVDVAIIGSGYTGLNAALQTTRGGRSTLILDANDAAWGCSSRNGGQASNSLKPDLERLAKQIGRQSAEGVLQEGLNALKYVDEVVKQENLDCDWVKCGRFVGAHNKLEYKKMLKIAGRNMPLKLPCHIISPDEVHNEIGTDFYHGGVVYPHVGALHPGKYSLELLDRVQARGAQVISHCEVTDVSKSAHGYMLSTAKGQVRARDVVIATNGYSGKLFPWLSRRIIPIGSYIIATEPLEKPLMDELLPTRRMICDTRRMVFYYRACPKDKRILFGGRVALREGDSLKSAPVLHQRMTEIFPKLANTRISHTWMGYVAFTFNTMPHIGRHEGMYYCMGYCGSGVSLASYFGMKIGKQVLGESEGDSPLSNVAFNTRPYYNGTPWFLAPSIMYYQMRDKIPI